MPYDPTYHLLGRFDKIRGRVRADPPDVLEAHSPYLATAAVVACGRPAPVQTCFWHADHLGTYVQPALEERVGRALAAAITGPLWRGVRALLAPFDATFVAGRTQADRLRRAGVPDVVHVPFGVDRRTFGPLDSDDVDPSPRERGAAGATDRMALRRELVGPWAGHAGADPARTVILVGVGRFAIEKRWDVVIDAFARVRAHRDAVLVLFGDGPERAHLERAAPSGVRFAGFETDRRRLARALGAADLLVHGCPYETYGLGVSEAVACGLPVVVPDAGGAAESADPSASETYPSLDAAACAAAIERILARDPGELRARAREAAARVPTLESHYDTVLATYAAILRERGRDSV